MTDNGNDGPMSCTCIACATKNRVANCSISWLCIKEIAKITIFMRAGKWEGFKNTITKGITGSSATILQYSMNLPKDSKDL